MPELYSSGFLMVFCNIIALIFVLVRWSTIARTLHDVSDRLAVYMLCLRHSLGDDHPG